MRTFPVVLDTVSAVPGGELDPDISSPSCPRRAAAHSSFRAKARIRHRRRVPLLSPPALPMGAPHISLAKNSYISSQELLFSWVSRTHILKSERLGLNPDTIKYPLYDLSQVALPLQAMMSSK